jgi:hypothetical protein
LLHLVFGKFIWQFTIVTKPTLLHLPVEKRFFHAL